MIRTNKYSKALAALFAVVMVLSMMAPSVGASMAADAGDATPTVEGAGDVPAVSDDVSYEQTSDGEFAQQDADEVDIESDHPIFDGVGPPNATRGSAGVPSVRPTASGTEAATSGSQPRAKTRAEAGDSEPKRGSYNAVTEGSPYTYLPFRD